MFSSIKTSQENKLRITELTNKLALGAENVIARIALGYSLSQNTSLDLKDIQDSKGKEYSKRVLFGEYFSIYVAMICQRYNIHKMNKDVPRYLKMHVDDGIEKIYYEFMENSNIQGFELLLRYINFGLEMQEIN